MAGVLVCASTIMHRPSSRKSTASFFMAGNYSALVVVRCDFADRFSGSIRDVRWTPPKQTGRLLDEAETMRIIAGNYRGRKIKSPPSLATRPTSDRLRETLFNILAPRIEGARSLDLCAGT